MATTADVTPDDLAVVVDAVESGAVRGQRIAERGVSICRHQPAPFMKSKESSVKPRLGRKLERQIGEITYSELVITMSA